MTKKAREITIYDIAKESGFSPKTVSRVLNNEKNVSASTIDKIKLICEKHNYTPNRYARNLKTKKDKTILLSVRISPGFPSLWVQMLIENIGLQCLESGITLITEYFYKVEDLHNSIVHNSKGIVDGVVLLYEHKDDQRIQTLKNHGTPFIIFERAMHSEVNYVGNDNYDALYTTYDKMCKNGLKTTLLLLGKPTQVNIDRVNGVISAFKDNGIGEEKVQIVYDMISAHEAYEYVVNNITRKNLPDLIFVSGDERAPGVYKALKQLDIQIPLDVSILGFDNISLGEHFDPPITTIEPNYKYIATEIIYALKTLFENSHYDSTVIKTKILKRDSVNPVFLK